MSKSNLNAAEIFNTEMPSKLNADSANVSKVDAVYQFNIDGDNGGTWTVDLTKESDFVSEGAADSPDCVVKMKESDFVDMWTGKLPGPQAFMMGKLTIEGDMSLAMKLQKFI